MRTIPWRQLTLWLAIGVLVAAAAAGLWLAARPVPRPVEDQVAEVSAGLRCPSCVGQSVAASESDLSRQMRVVIAEQLADGRSPDQIRSWFAERYGDEVLLDPPATGVGLAVRLLPLALLAIGAVLVGLRLWGRRGLVLGTGLALALAGGLLAMGALGPLRPVSTDAWAPPSRPLPSTGTSDSVAVAGASRQALIDLQAGRLDEAEQQATALLRSAPEGSRVWQDGLLVLALVEYQRGDPGAKAMLRTFLADAPDHPAAPSVRVLLTGR